MVYFIFDKYKYMIYQWIKSITLKCEICQGNNNYIYLLFVNYKTKNFTPKKKKQKNKIFGMVLHGAEILF